VSALVDTTVLRGLHGAIRIALMAQNPLGARKTARMLGRFLRPYASVSEAQLEARRLSGGTCLSRALTIAARLPDAEVVIAVNPRVSAHCFAHAWVEVGGTPLEDSAERRMAKEIARL
jgi:hypothetical protein